MEFTGLVQLSSLSVCQRLHYTKGYGAPVNRLCPLVQLFIMSKTDSNDFPTIMGKIMGPARMAVAVSPERFAELLKSNDADFVQVLTSNVMSKEVRLCSPVTCALCAVDDWEEEAPQYEEEGSSYSASGWGAEATELPESGNGYGHC